MSTKTKLIIAIIVAIPLIALGLSLVSKQNTSTSENGTNQPNNSETQSANRPVPENNPYVQTVVDMNSNMVRYTFTGTVKEIKSHERGQQLVLNGSSVDLPTIVITSDTRVQAIKYNPVVLTAKTVADLKAGTTVDVSMDFEVSTKRWYVRDIYIPVDRNP